jgi:hypothetical protein
VPANPNEIPEKNVAIEPNVEVAYLLHGFDLHPEVHGQLAGSSIWPKGLDIYSVQRKQILGVPAAHDGI